jgi:hypothetical protein
MVCCDFQGKIATRFPWVFSRFMISAPMKMASFYTPVSNSQCQAGIHPWSMKFGAPEMFKTVEMRKRSQTMDLLHTFKNPTLESTTETVRRPGHLPHQHPVGQRHRPTPRMGWDLTNSSPWFFHGP